MLSNQMLLKLEVRNAELVVMRNHLKKITTRSKFISKVEKENSICDDESLQAHVKMTKSSQVALKKALQQVNSHTTTLNTCAIANDHRAVIWTDRR